jgi:lipid-binding SYLF domain-containing protein
MKKNRFPKFLFNFIAIIVLLVSLSPSVYAASATEIDAKVNAIMKNLYEEVNAAKQLADKADGILVFPSIIKAGLGIGGEYGEGALRIKGRTVSYYNTVTASIGFQFGVQSKAVVLMFMTKKALTDFRNSEGWEVGVDGSVAIATFGAGGSIDSNTLKNPIIGFIFNNKGLMYNLSLEGSKITRIKKSAL